MIIILYIGGNYDRTKKYCECEKCKVGEYNGRSMLGCMNDYDHSWEVEYKSDYKCGVDGCSHHGFCPFSEEEIEEAENKYFLSQY